MLRLATDEHIDRALIRGLLARETHLDILRVQEAGLLGADPGFAYERVRTGESMPGVFIVDDRLPLGKAIDKLLILAMCSADDEWRDQVVYVPMG